MQDQFNGIKNSLINGAGKLHIQNKHDTHLEASAHFDSLNMREIPQVAFFSVVGSNLHFCKIRLFIIYFIPPVLINHINVPGTAQDKITSQLKTLTVLAGKTITIEW